MVLALAAVLEAVSSRGCWGGGWPVFLALYAMTAPEGHLLLILAREIS
jgi:hypothetical protein